MNFEFHTISNESINSTFLARFVANKFRRTYTLREVLNPLMRELSRVTQLYNFKSQRANKNYTKGHQIFIEKEELKRIWGTLFKTGNDSYKKHMLNLFETGNT